MVSIFFIQLPSFFLNLNFFFHQKQPVRLLASLRRSDFYRDGCGRTPTVKKSLAMESCITLGLLAGRRISRAPTADSRYGTSLPFAF